MTTPLSRRTLLSTAAGSALALGLPGWFTPTARADQPLRLKPAPGNAYLSGAPYPATPVWCYNGQTPGPEIRVRQGERLRVVLENGLDQDTTVHWHGIRLPVAMDGVPGLSQPPIKPGETFTYDFALPDAGTYWYHPHVNGAEQIGRGLSGALIVEERNPVTVDRELTWVLDDWLLTPDATISDDFGQLGAMSHGGRIGNTATVNGRIQPTVAVRSGERLRLRLINAATARTFALRFEGPQPQIIAVDGHPITPHAPDGDTVVLPAAARVDLMLDTTAAPGSRFRVLDRAYRGRSFTLLDLRYRNQPPLRERAPETPIALPANAVPEPDLREPARHSLTFTGGAMGGLRGAEVDGEFTDMRAMAQRGLLWADNGVAATGVQMPPAITLAHGQTCLLTLINDSAFPHPIHLHGHAFRVLSRNGEPSRYRPWHDTVLVSRGERVEVGFVADNPGDWLCHCHVLGHQASGMSAVLRVA